MRLTKSFTYHQNLSHSKPLASISLMGVLLASLIPHANALEKTNNLTLNPPVFSNNPIKFLSENFKQLPEKQISIGRTNDTYALYTPGRDRAFLAHNNIF